jgi:outer membrane cobalamin receptor
LKSSGPNSTSFGSGLGGVINLFAREIPMDEFQTKSTTTYGSFGLFFETKFSGNYGEASDQRFRQLSIICKVMAFAKIPLMIENHSRYKANKR